MATASLAGHTVVVVLAEVLTLQTMAGRQWVQEAAEGSSSPWLLREWRGQWSLRSLS